MRTTGLPDETATRYLAATLSTHDARRRAVYLVGYERHAAAPASRCSSAMSADRSLILDTF